MFDFDGNVGGGSKVNMAGAGRARNRTGGENRSDFVKKQHKERQARENKRIQERAATIIQAKWLQYRSVKSSRHVQRHIFDKRIADISKVGAVLPPDAKAKFACLALMPAVAAGGSFRPTGLLRLFGYFFTASVDAGRLAALRELVIMSSTQAATGNVFHLAISEDSVQRLAFLVLFRKLMIAALRTGPPMDAMRLFLAIKTALFTGFEFTPLHGQFSQAAVGYIIQRTDVLGTLSRHVVPEAKSAQSKAQVLELIMLCCVGMESCDAAQKQEPLLSLFSAPHLGDVICANLPTVQPTLKRLVATFPHVPPAGSFAALLSEQVGGSSRAIWFLRNLVTVLDLHLLPAKSSPSLLSFWIDWLCWARLALVNQTQEPIHGVFDRLHSASFVRELVLAVDSPDPHALLSVCHLYFSAMDSTGDSEPPSEVLQTLAFATPLAERLFPTLRDLVHVSADAAFAVLGPPSMTTPEAVRLRIFCTVFALQMQPMYDYEFFGDANPLKMSDVETLTRFLNRLAYHIVTKFPNKTAMEPAARALRVSLTSLVSLLYNRHCRKPILGGDTAWIIPESRLLIRRAPIVDLGTDGQDDGAALSDARDGDGMDVDEDADAMDDVSSSQPGRSGPGAGTTGSFGSAGSPAGAEQILEAVLEEIPHVVPFHDRVELLHNVIQNDQVQRRETRGPWAQAAMQRNQIRRNFLVEDGFAAFERLTEEGGLRDVFRVEFIGPDGNPESGVDGGGLFKEFLITLNRAVFDPEFGLFSETSERTLYPAVNAFRTHDKAGDLYAFLGKVVGKAIYEMFLLEAQFSRVFLNRLLGRTNEVDDVAALDSELYRNILRIKGSDDIDSLGVTFSVSVSEGGHYEEVDLISDGRNVLVTKDNLTRYFHLMANFKTNVQFQRQTQAFLRGLQCVIPPSWLKMFDPYELNILVSGSTQGFDVVDLKRHTNYSGGYQEDSPVVQWLWAMLENMEPVDMSRFLMFITSCSRPPLLGFKTLFPAFCIHRVPDGERLPTASTCANLLKLPDYCTAEVLNVKVLQSIRSEAGFDLS